MFKSLSLFAAVALTASIPNAAHAVTIANASFETVGAGVNGAAAFATISGNQLPGWTIDPGTVDHIGSYWTAADGLRSIDLNGNGLSAISQTLTGLSVGTQYIVSFFVSGNPDNGRLPNPKEAELTLGGDTFDVSYTLTGANTTSNMLWQQRSYSFTASSETALLRLASVSGSAFGLAVDNFSITAVPEPATWMMMILGFGIAGAAIRRAKPSRVLLAV